MKRNEVMEYEAEIETGTDSWQSESYYHPLTSSIITHRNALALAIKWI